MTANDDWKAIVASSLDWEQAHLNLEHAVADLTPELRATRPAGLTHSVWDIVEHIRIAQHDLLDFVSNAHYHHDLAWPADYWPAATDAVGDEDWGKSLDAFKRDREKLKTFTTSRARPYRADTQRDRADVSSHHSRRARSRLVSHRRDSRRAAPDKRLAARRIESPRNHLPKVRRVRIIAAS